MEKFEKLNKRILCKTRSDRSDFVDVQTQINVQWPTRRRCYVRRNRRRDRRRAVRHAGNAVPTHAATTGPTPYPLHSAASR